MFRARRLPHAEREGYCLMRSVRVTRTSKSRESERVVTSPFTIRIATRASALALWQAQFVADRLRAAVPDCTVEIVEISTAGDRDTSQPLSQLGGFGVFTREVQKAVLDGRADVAVHSLKDLPTNAVAGLVLAAVPPRGSTFDVLVLPAPDSTGHNPAVSSLETLPPSARVGTGSLRRQAQLLHFRSDLQMLDVRGNVETRLKKLDEGQYDALVLAAAGLQRLGLHERIAMELLPPLMYPAVGQGAVGVECRADDEDTRAALQQISDEPTHVAVTAERSLLADLRAGCHAPLGVSTQVENDRLSLTAVVLSPDGTQCLTASAESSIAVAEALGRLVGDDLRRQGAQTLIDAARPGS
jgi:hydroxymethylbilane synthase